MTRLSGLGPAAAVACGLVAATGPAAAQAPAWRPPPLPTVIHPPVERFAAPSPAAAPRPAPVRPGHRSAATERPRGAAAGGALTRGPGDPCPGAACPPGR